METNPSVSIITPTYGRGALLPLAYRMYAAQQDIATREWIVIDDSPQPSQFMQGLADPDVRYVHLPGRLSVGEKRNLAIDAARGNIIVQFDDDAYYAPSYLKAMLRVMQSQQADFVKLSAFFLYSFVLKKFGYWNLLSKTGLHFLWGAGSKEAIVLSPREAENRHLGYGFSYVFNKQVWQRNPFPATNFCEDDLFIKAAIRNGYKITLINDDGEHSGLCLRLLHWSNSSDNFPQYIIPEFIARQQFPGFFERLPEYTAAIQPPGQPSRLEPVPSISA